MWRGAPRPSRRSEARRNLPKRSSHHNSPPVQVHAPQDGFPALTRRPLSAPPNSLNFQRRRHRTRPSAEVVPHHEANAIFSRSQIEPVAIDHTLLPDRRQSLRGQMNVNFLPHRTTHGFAFGAFRHCHKVQRNMVVVGVVDHARIGRQAHHESHVLPARLFSRLDLVPARHQRQ